MPNTMVKTINRNLVKAAVMRVIFCPGCDNILVMRRAVFVTATNKDTDKETSAVVCGKCWDKTADFVAKKLTDLDVLDGRVLWGRQKK